MPCSHVKYSLVFPSESLCKTAAAKKQTKKKQNKKNEAKAREMTLAVIKELFIILYISNIFY